MQRDRAEIDLIEDSFERVKIHKAEFSNAFYTRLFKDYPELEPLFSNTDMDRQGSKLYAALVLLVENLRHPEELERVLLPLGEKHVGYGATPEAFPKVGKSITATLQLFLGDRWTPELSRAWENTFRDVTATMLRGAGIAVPEQITNVMPTSYEYVSNSGSADTAQLVQVSFAQIGEDYEAFTEAFYNELFRRNSHLRPLFESVDIKMQGKKLHAALVLLVENIRQPGEIEKILLPLGKKHIAYGATAESYPLVGEALLATLERFLGTAWSKDIADAWSETIEQVITLMLDGAHDAPGTTVSSASAPKLTHSKIPYASQNRDKESSASSPRPRSENRFTHWFYSVRFSTLVGLWAVIGVGLISLSFVFPEMRSVAIFANPLSLLLALFLYLRETPERKKQFHYHAWSTIDHAAHVKTSNARFLALQDLCEDGVSLKGLALEEADLKGIDLSGADLASANLCSCNLSGGSLTSADLNNATLVKANFSGAQLSGANLGFAKLIGANFSSADLRDTNLMFADLSDANLSGVNLAGAKLSGANFSGTYLGGANLRDTDISVADLDDAFLVGALMPQNDGERV